MFLWYQYLLFLVLTYQWNTTFSWQKASFCYLYSILYYSNHVKELYFLAHLAWRRQCLLRLYQLSLVVIHRHIDVDHLFKVFFRCGRIPCPSLLLCSSSSAYTLCLLVFLWEGTAEQRGLLILCSSKVRGRSSDVHGRQTGTMAWHGLRTRECYAGGCGTKGWWIQDSPNELPVRL